MRYLPRSFLVVSCVVALSPFAVAFRTAEGSALVTSPNGAAGDQPAKTPAKQNDQGGPVVPKNGNSLDGPVVRTETDTNIGCPTGAVCAPAEDQTTETDVPEA